MLFNSILNTVYGMTKSLAFSNHLERPAKIIVDSDGDSSYVFDELEMLKKLKSDNPIYLRLVKHLENFEKISGGNVGGLIAFLTFLGNLIRDEGMDLGRENI